MRHHWSASGRLVPHRGQYSIFTTPQSLDLSPEDTRAGTRDSGKSAEEPTMRQVDGRAATYIWPSTLRMPPRPPKLIYLDLLHWVSLAKAHTGHRDGEPFREVLDRCLAAVEAGVAVFPISDAIYMEVLKIKQHRQRRDLRDVIEQVSRFIVVTSRVMVAAHEVEAMLDSLVGPSPNPANTVDYLDWGVARAFGMVGGFRVLSEDTAEDVTDDVRSKHPDGPEAFDRRLHEAEVELNRRTLEGPTAEEEPELRAQGWDPRASYEVAERRAGQEREQAERFNAHPSWRRGRTRDVVAAREITIELEDMLRRGLVERGVTLETALSDPGEAMKGFNAMPSFDVSVTLKTAYHRDGSHLWTPNDILDIDALSSTVPYCDVVVTDKAAASNLVRASVAERLRTTILSRITELPAHLA